VLCVAILAIFTIRRCGLVRRALQPGYGVLGTMRVRISVEPFFFVVARVQPARVDPRVKSRAVLGEPGVKR